MTRGRRSRSRRNQRFSAGDWRVVVPWLVHDFSPEQLSGWLRRRRELSISHETIYKYIWADRRRGGTLHRHLRGARKQRRKRYGHYDSRGRLAGKRPIAERPPGAENRSRVGHLEGDTVLGTDKHCLLTLVDRKTGFTWIGKLRARTVEATNQAAIALIHAAPRTVRSVTVDNGTEFHGYKDIEASSASMPRKEPAWLASPRETATVSPPSSTTDLANASAFEPPRNAMTLNRQIGDSAHPLSCCTSNLIPDAAAPLPV